jgi:hypothetical protein
MTSLFHCQTSARIGLLSSATILLFLAMVPVSSFLRSNTANNAPSANFVSAKNLLQPCPPSLLKALHPSNPDRDVWLKSYSEEKGGLIDLNVYDRINKKTYLQLRRSGKIGKALPSMCVLVIKPDKDRKPHRAKSRIVVLGNHEDRYYTKSQRYASVLKYTSVRLLCSKAVEAKRVLQQQGDCKNAFCHAKLPPHELTVVMPPVGDPAHRKGEYWLLNKTLYGLRGSPHHWYNMFCTALKELGLKQSVHDPCLFSGNLASDASPSTKSKLHVVFYSEDPDAEKEFERQLKQKVVVDFMGDVDYFLGTAFTWKHLPGGHLSVHLCQLAFTEYTAHRFAIDRYNRTPNMTPYRSGLPIDSIPMPDPKDPDLKQRTKVYQSIVGCINWLATSTRPDVSPVLSFFASYMHAPSHQHYKSALHMPSSISTAHLTMVSLSIPMQAIPYKLLTISPTFTTKKHTRMHLPPPLVTVTISLLSAMPAGVAKLARPLSYLNSAACLVFLSAEQGGRSHGEPSGKVKQLSAPLPTSRVRQSPLSAQAKRGSHARTATKISYHSCRSLYGQGGVDTWKSNFGDWRAAYLSAMSRYQVSPLS